MLRKLPPDEDPIADDEHEEKCRGDSYYKNDDVRKRWDRESYYDSDNDYDERR